MARSTKSFDFCILGNIVFLLCPELAMASAKNASTEFALYNFNDSTINCSGEKNLASLGDNDNGGSSISIHGDYNPAVKASAIDYESKYEPSHESGFCSYKNHIQFSNDSSFSTMFSLTRSGWSDEYDEDAASFFVAGNCDIRSARSASGCPGSSKFLDSSLVVQFFLLSSILQTSIYGGIYATVVDYGFSDIKYVWIDCFQNSTTFNLLVSLSSDPCSPKVVKQALRLPRTAPSDTPFNSGSVVGFYSDPMALHILASEYYREYYSLRRDRTYFNVWGWSFNTSGPTEDMYGGDDCGHGSTHGLEIRTRSGLTPAVSVVITFVVGLGILLVPGLVCFFCRRRRKQSLENKSLEQATEKLEMEKNHLLARLKLLNFGAREFTYKELQQATENFADEIGRGGFGLVFKGTLQGVGTVAVKKINKTKRNVEDAKQLVAEVEVIGSVRHVNIVPLHGWCHEKGVMLLVYKFIDNDNLSMHLFPDNPSAAPPLAWTKRMKILRGVASALVFLHEEFESEERVIHRDIKPTNVMLDSEFNARLGDFGLARLSKRTDSGHQSQSIAGTFGYIAPEYSSGATTQTDVYSFGVLILVVATARKPLDRSLKTSGQEAFGNLVGWVRHLYDQGRILEAGDETLRNDSNWSIQDSEEMERVLKVGLCCCLFDANQRPTMRQALTALQELSTMFSAPLALHSPNPLEYPSFESWSRAFEYGTVISESVSLLSNCHPCVYGSQSLNVSENITGSRPQNRVVRFQERVEDHQDMDMVNLD